MKKNKLKLILGVCLSSMMLFSCGDPAENMNKTMADFSERIWMKNTTVIVMRKRLKSILKLMRQKYMKNGRISTMNMPDELS